MQNRNRDNRGNSYRVFATVALATLMMSAVQATAADRPYTMVIDVRLTAAAEKLLTSQREGIVVSSNFYGTPTRAAAYRADQIGRIQLGNARAVLEGNGGKARFKTSALPQRRLSWIKGNPQVNINVYSARRRGPDNILDCDFFEGSLPSALVKPIKLKCGILQIPK